MKKRSFDWLLVGCHHISEVAVAYYPNYVYNVSAVKALRRSFQEHSHLLRELTDAGYTAKTVHLTPMQIAVVIRYWGLPDQPEEMIEKNPYLRVPKTYGKI